MCYTFYNVAHDLLFVKWFREPFINFGIIISNSIDAELGRQAFHLFSKSGIQISEFGFRLDLPVGTASEESICKLCCTSSRSYIILPMRLKHPEMTGFPIKSVIVNLLAFLDPIFFVSNETGFLGQFFDPYTQSGKESADFMCRCFGICDLCVCHTVFGKWHAGWVTHPL